MEKTGEYTNGGKCSVNGCPNKASTEVRVLDDVTYVCEPCARKIHVQADPMFKQAASITQSHRE